MKKINSNIKFLYLFIICSSFINILGVLNIIPMIKILNLIIWFIIFIIGIFITKNDYNHFYNVKDKIEILFIILLIYFMAYFSLGLLFGFSYNVYDNSNWLNILKNILYYIVPIFFQEYIRGTLCNYSRNNKYTLFLITLIYILINFNYVGVNNIFSTGENFLKFICLNIVPLISTELVMTYLCKVGSYKLSLFYKILMNIYIIFIPILPNINFFINGIIFMVIPVIVYFVIDNYHIKETQKTYFEYKKNYMFEYTPVIIIITIFICNLLGVFKYQTYSILSDSMNPLYYRGDAIVIKKISKEEIKQLKVGDIIAFNENGNVIIHRIYKIDDSTENVVYTTKGDNNDNVDSKLVKEKDIKGKYLFKIKFLGYPRYFINDILNK